MKTTVFKTSAGVPRTGCQRATPARPSRSRRDSSEKFHLRLKNFRCSLRATATATAYPSLPPQYPFIWGKEMEVQRAEGKGQMLRQPPESLCYKDPFQRDLPSGGVSREVKHTDEAALCHAQPAKGMRSPPFCR